MCEVKLSQNQQGLYGIVGHVGVGHVHSHSGFVQDDSAGFAVVSTLLKKAVDVDTTIKSASVCLKTGAVKITTNAGGEGVAFARRGFTPAEQEIVQRAVGQDASFTQNVAVNTFGHIYGQGAMETSVALQGACALAVMDSFKMALGDKMLFVKEEYPNKFDQFAGTVLDIDGLPVAIMLVINATNGGIGPDEDYEGNTNFTAKGEMMAKLGLDKVPSVVVESKAYIPAMAATVPENQYMIRAQKDVDCTELGKAVYETGLALGLPVRFEDSIMPINPGGLEKATHAIAEKIIALAAGVDTVKAGDIHTVELDRLMSNDGTTHLTIDMYNKLKNPSKEDLYVFYEYNKFFICRSGSRYRSRYPFAAELAV